nr:MAG TPA: hypothetical protein [Caudoviricetes sp.]
MFCAPALSIPKFHVVSQFYKSVARIYNYTVYR